MQYFITFLEGLISFISPCILPMLPIYLSYFAGTASENGNTGTGENAKSGKNDGVLVRALAFVVGFTVVFSLLGLFAGTLGVLLNKYRTAVNIVSGAIVVLLGLSFMEVIRIPFFNGVGKARKITGIFSAFLFGVVFSISLTPCVGAFLGSALMLASSSGGALKGMLLLLSYSLGMGIPFVLSAVLIDKLSVLFSAIKKHYRVINIVCGVFLIIVGIAMMFGVLNGILVLFS